MARRTALGQAATTSLPRKGPSKVGKCEECGRVGSGVLSFLFFLRVGNVTDADDRFEVNIHEG